MTKNKPSAQDCINNTVNKTIALTEVKAFKQASKTATLCYSVRVMIIYDAKTNEQTEPKDTVGTLAKIAEWSATGKRKKEFDQLMVSLVLLAKGKAADEPRRVEKTELDDEIWEIKAPGQQMRLFAFIADNQVIIISEHYHKHGKPAREERKLQDRAIQRAVARRDMFKGARRIAQDVYQVETKAKS